MAQKNVCVFHRQCEEIKFLGRKMTLIVATPEHVTLQIQRQVTYLDHPANTRCTQARSPENLLYPGLASPVTFCARSSATGRGHPRTWKIPTNCDITPWNRSPDGTTSPNSQQEDSISCLTCTNLWRSVRSTPFEGCCPRYRVISWLIAMRSS